MAHVCNSLDSLRPSSRVVCTRTHVRKSRKNVLTAIEKGTPRSVNASGDIRVYICMHVYVYARMYEQTRTSHMRHAWRPSCACVYANLSRIVSVRCKRLGYVPFKYVENGYCIHVTKP